MKVPEIWRFDGRVLRFCTLQHDGAYADGESSRAFPFLKPEHLTPLLRLDEDKDETSHIRDFVRSLREQEFTR